MIIQISMQKNFRETHELCSFSRELGDKMSPKFLVPGTYGGYHACYLYLFTTHHNKMTGHPPQPLPPPWPPIALRCPFQHNEPAHYIIGNTGRCQARLVCYISHCGGLVGGTEMQPIMKLRDGWSLCLW
jgi:hypothetical protein